MQPSALSSCREFRLKFAKERISMGRLETINFKGGQLPLLALPSSRLWLV